MFLVRYASLAALVVWVGGMIVLGLVVAPSLFPALEATDPISGRMNAGMVFGEILRHFDVVAYSCGVVLLVSLFVMKFLGPPPQVFVVRAAISATMLALALYSGMLLTPEIAQAQAQIGVPIAHLSDSDPRRLRFDQLHKRSTTLMTVNIALGLILLFWYAKE